MFRRSVFLRTAFLIFGAENMRIIGKTCSSNVTGVTSTMSVLNRIEINLDVDYRSSFNCTFRGLWIKVKNASSSPTAITIRMTADVNGDNVIIPDTDSAITFGLSTITKGSAVYSIDMAYVSGSNEKLYLFLCTDTGTVDVDEVCLTWEDYTR